MRLFILLFFATTFSSYSVKAQSDSLMNSVYEFKFEERKYEPRKVVYLFADKNSALVKYNPVSLVFGGLLMFYQKVISQQLASNCPYEISCSEFSRLSIKEYGLIKGVSLSADRLTRCTQFTKIDINPSWFNDDYRIIDPVERWSLKYYKHDHDHNHKHKH